MEKMLFISELIILISSLHIDNRNKNILVFGEESKGIKVATITAEAKYLKNPINFTEPEKKICIRSALYWKQYFSIC